MIIEEQEIKGVYEITLSPIEDKRGFFMRTYDKELFVKYRIHREWVQENHSWSAKKGTIRGLHFQLPPYTETKLVRCIKGSIFDVFVDIRKNSPTYGQWDSLVLSKNNKKMLFIPSGFAHGFCALTDDCEIVYKVDNLYYPEAQGGIIWNDKELNIDWPLRENPILSKRDVRLSSFAEFTKKYNGIDISKESV